MTILKNQFVDIPHKKEKNFFWPVSHIQTYILANQVYIKALSTEVDFLFLSAHAHLYKM